ILDTYHNWKQCQTATNKAECHEPASDPFQPVWNLTSNSLPSMWCGIKKIEWRRGTASAVTQPPQHHWMCLAATYFSLPTCLVIEGPPHTADCADKAAASFQDRYLLLPETLDCVKQQISDTYHNWKQC
ncbi:hypothetical protein HJC23_000087, partial [Cyclotella cryptica]